MARYAGNKGLVYMSTTGAGTAVSVALSSWTLDASTAKIDVTQFLDMNLVRVQGLPDFNGALSGFWDDTSDALYDASGSTSAVKMYLYPSQDAISKYWYGTAWVDFNINTAVNAGVAIGANWVAGGSWGQM